VPVVALGHNGIGLGHVSRLIGICEAIAGAGGKPILVAEGSGYTAVPHTFPSGSLPHLREQSVEVQSEIGRTISNLALLSHPSFVVEDTHPLPLTLAEQVSRVLIFRPTLWRELRKFKRECSHKFRTIFVADHPLSPTWPYSETQTRVIRSWKNWSFLGPIYRHPTKSEIQDVKRRYQWSRDTRLCLFSMGGGGEHFGAEDAAGFCRRALSLGKSILGKDPSVRLIFVAGPLFKQYGLIPRIFQIVKNEPFMPALFAIADAAVIRPGFNSVWECIAGGTPILPVMGTSYREPIALRMKKLRSIGIARRSFKDFWNNDIERMRIGRTCNLIRRRWERGKASRIVEALQMQLPQAPRTAGPGTACERKAPHRLTEARNVESQVLQNVCCSKRVSIRIDDVTSLNGATRAIVELCSRHSIGVSLEIVPYLNDISHRDLARLTLRRTAIEVGQHGYSHVQRSHQAEPKSEFSWSAVGVEREMDEISKGKAILEKRFPEHFRKGFSPPFDGLPAWLPECWAQLGGKYLSVIQNRPVGARIPFTMNSIDIWNWERVRRHSSSRIRHSIVRSIFRSGHAGLVLHPGHFLNDESIAWLDRLLHWLLDTGVEFVLPSQVAKLQAAKVFSSTLRRYESLAHF
jgi:hypothetical protein